MNIKRLLIIGGDLRIAHLAQSLRSDGYVAESFKGAEPLKNAVDRCDAVILGLPATKDDKTVDAPELAQPILIKDLFKIMGRGKLLLAGRMSDGMKAVADVFSVRWADYFNRDEFELLNAIPTCEGALQAAMEELPVTIHSCNAIVTGYGRIGRLLAHDLSALGANVTVAARKTSARSLAKTDNVKAVDFTKLCDEARKADVIFNTVPSRVIGRDVVFAARNALIIDLASKPGGVDMEAAKDAGTRVIWALGLPGKVAPVTAGNIIKETIYNIFSELGE